MQKTYNVDPTYNDMRIDRWVRNNIGNIPQGLIEKNLRNGKIKVNRKKIKSSHKVKGNDQIDLYWCKCSNRVSNGIKLPMFVGCFTRGRHSQVSDQHLA